jgi:hypothetical protein
MHECTNAQMHFLLFLFQLLKRITCLVYGIAATHLLRLQSPQFKFQ